MSKKITVHQIEDQEIKEIKPILVTAVLMPNGEIIYKGQTIGWYEKDKKYIFVNE